MQIKNFAFERTSLDNLGSVSGIYEKPDLFKVYNFEGYNLSITIESQFPAFGISNMSGSSIESIIIDDGDEGQINIRAFLIKYRNEHPQINEFLRLVPHILSVAESVAQRFFSPEAELQPEVSEQEKLRTYFLKNLIPGEEVTVVDTEDTKIHTAKINGQILLIISPDLVVVDTAGVQYQFPERAGASVKSGDPIDASHVKLRNISLERVVAISDFSC